jgi:PadR family transcriptional regulator, regulatory protein PadR
MYFPLPLHLAKNLSGRESSQQTELLRAVLKMLVLESLEKNAEPMPDYGIASYIRETSSEVLEVEESSLYTALKSLARKGWVKAKWGQSDKHRRARFYTLTPAGRKQLQQEVADFERTLEAIMRVLQLA